MGVSGARATPPPPPHAHTRPTWQWARRQTPPPPPPPPGGGPRARVLLEALRYEVAEHRAPGAVPELGRRVARDHEDDAQRVHRPAGRRQLGHLDGADAQRPDVHLRRRQGEGRGRAEGGWGRCQAAGPRAARPAAAAAARQRQRRLPGSPPPAPRRRLPRTLPSYLLSWMTSGAIQCGVPMNVWRLVMVLVSCAATPKSASFTSPAQGGEGGGGGGGASENVVGVQPSWSTRMVARRAFFCAAAPGARECVCVGGGGAGPERWWQTKGIARKAPT
jgi:hypothetical protein